MKSLVKEGMTGLMRAIMKDQFLTVYDMVRALIPIPKKAFHMMDFGKMG